MLSIRHRPPVHNLQSDMIRNEPGSIAGEHKTAKRATAARKDQQKQGANNALLRRAVYSRNI